MNFAGQSSAAVEALAHGTPDYAPYVDLLFGYAAPLQHGLYFAVSTSHLFYLVVNTDLAVLFDRGDLQLTN
jgi:hypothetical protein